MEPPEPPEPPKGFEERYVALDTTEAVRRDIMDHHMNLHNNVTYAYYGTAAARRYASDDDEPGKVTNSW